MCRAFQNLTIEKLKAGIFVCPQIRKLVNDENLNSDMTPQEASAWQAFVDVVQTFLGNQWNDNYEQIVQNLVSRYRENGANNEHKITLPPQPSRPFPRKYGNFN